MKKSGYNIDLICRVNPNPCPRQQLKCPKCGNNLFNLYGDGEEEIISCSKYDCGWGCTIGRSHCPSCGRLGIKYGEYYSTFTIHQY